MTDTAATVMNPHPTVLHPDDKISTAIRYIMEKRYRRLPVVDAEGRFKGIFGVNCLLRLTLPKAVVMEKGLDNVHFVRETLSDLHRRIAQYADQPISVCMHFDTIQVPPDMPLLETLLLLYQTRASIPVVDPETEKLLGVISYWDVGERVLAAEL